MEESISCIPSIESLNERTSYSRAPITQQHIDVDFLVETRQCGPLPQKLLVSMAVVRRNKERLWISTNTMPKRPYWRLVLAHDMNGSISENLSID